MTWFKNNGDSDTDGGINNILTDEVGDQFNLIRKVYEDSEGGEAPKAHVEKYGPVPGSYSIFNPFKIFRYSKFGLNPGEYNTKMHFDSPNNNMNSNQAAEVSGGGNKFGGSTGASLHDAATGKVQSEFKPFVQSRKNIENPTASEIVNWAKSWTKKEGNGAISPVPYAPEDFLWCKYYGKVPNNRMVTLRRYPIPVEDNILIADSKSPLVPIAQGVTWYGDDIGNPLNSVLNLNWGLNWTERTAEVQDIAGNEISVEDIANAAGLGGAENEKLVSILKSQVFSDGDKIDVLKLSGYDASIQEYIKASYTADGPYWNRILGPVNVIHKTQIRDRGFKDQGTIKMSFEYSLRSYGGLNPKIAFLDLLSNFLSLTYNNAPFWGGGARYFQKTGVTIPGLGIEQKMLEGDVLGGIQAGLEQLSQQANANLGELVELAQRLASGDLNDPKSIEAERKNLDRKFKAGPVERLLAPRVGMLMKKPLIYRSILDGRAVGEWHVTIGNPMNPMAMIGNLCLENVDMEVGEVLGIDDFPTEFKFTITLKHGRPRAKQDIESIFNLGNGAMGFSQLPQPSSADNSYGESNTRRQNAAYEGLNPEDPESEDPSLTSAVSNPGESNNGSSQASDQGKVLQNGDKLESIIAEYSRQVRRKYGDGFGNSPILTDYFKQLKTKD